MSSTLAQCTQIIGKITKKGVEGGEREGETGREMKVVDEKLKSD